MPWVTASSWHWPALSLGTGEVWTSSSYAWISSSAKLLGMKAALGTNSKVTWFRKCVG